jgi:hypothetical protein
MSDGWMKKEGKWRRWMVGDGDSYTRRKCEREGAG